MSKVLVVHKKSSLELFTEAPPSATRDRALADEARRESHQIHTASLQQVLAVLDSRGVDYQKIYRSELQPVDTSLDAIIIVGGDGTTLDTTHYVSTADIPIIGVNSDPTSSVGFYTCCTADTFAGIFDSLDNQPRTTFPRLEVLLNGQQILEPVLNDILVAHSSPAAYTRYVLTVDGKKIVNQANNNRLRSSGLVIATAGGSTAWMYNLQGTIMPLTSTTMQYKERDVRNLPIAFAEREIKIESLTREGRIFIDGDHIQYPFTLGDTVLVKAGHPVQIVGNIDLKRQQYREEKVPRKFTD